MADIVKASKLRTALSKAKTIKEKKAVVDFSGMIIPKAKRIGMTGREVNQLAHIHLDAQREIGQDLIAMGERRGRPRKNFQHGSFPSNVDLGITDKDAHRWRWVAGVEKTHYDAYIQSVLDGDGSETITRGGLKASEVLRIRAERAAKRDARRRENIEKVKGIKTLDGLVESGAHFATIVIDPPWDWGDEGDVNQLGRAKPDYAGMPLEEIGQQPVGKLADEDCHLYLWITNRSLPKGFGLLEAWGFRYITCLSWVKPSFGMGNYFRGSTEHILFGVKGSQLLARKDVGTWFEADRPTRHSEKPDFFYHLAETCSPAPRLDIFGRKARKAWTVSGEDGIILAEEGE